MLTATSKCWTLQLASTREGARRAWKQAGATAGPPLSPGSRPGPAERCSGCGRLDRFARTRGCVRGTLARAVCPGAAGRPPKRRWAPATVSGRSAGRCSDARLCHFNFHPGTPCWLTMGHLLLSHRLWGQESC